MTLWLGALKAGCQLFVEPCGWNKGYRVAASLDHTSVPTQGKWGQWVLDRGGQWSFQATAVWLGFSFSLSYLNVVPYNKAVDFKSSSDYMIVKLRDIFVTRSHLGKGLIEEWFRKLFLFIRIPLLKQLMTSETFSPAGRIGFLFSGFWQGFWWC